MGRPLELLSNTVEAFFSVVVKKNYAPANCDPASAHDPATNTSARQSWGQTRGRGAEAAQQPPRGAPEDSRGAGGAGPSRAAPPAAPDTGEAVHPVHNDAWLALMASRTSQAESPEAQARIALLRQLVLAPVDPKSVTSRFRGFSVTNAAGKRDVRDELGDGLETLPF